MQNLSTATACCVAIATVLSGCVVDRPTRSDGEGPAIDIAISGGAEFTLDEETPRRTPADNCAIVRDVPGGSVNNRRVDVSVAPFDRSGMNRFQFTVQGDGIRDGSIVVTPSPNPTWGFNNTRDVDVITLTFLPEADGVLNAAVVQFTIDSPFTPGVTISAVGTDTFGNETRFAPFQLLSELADGTCNF